VDDYYGSGSADGASSTSPLDPTWKPAPQLHAADALDMAQPSFAFSAPTPVAEAAAPAVALAPTAPALTPSLEAPAVALTAAPAAPLIVAAVPAAAPAPVSPVPASQQSPAHEVPSTAPPAVSAFAAHPTSLPEKPAAESGGARIGAEDTSLDSGFLSDLLIETLDRGCSDLHLTVGAPPTVRQHGSLMPMEDRAVLTPNTLTKVLYAILSQKQREKFEEELELDFAYSVPGRARFRVNIYRQKDALGAAFRLIPYEIKPLEDLGVPPAVSNFAMLPRGFVLITGPTGSGKSTTLAAVVDLANRNRRDHIMSVEDPIEFLHEHKSCLVNQREVGEDTHSFKNALKHVLRQDPDIILVGEMRDLETIEIALTAAETGHLVMATLHTQDAAQTIDRVIDVFPPHQQQQVRTQLAGAIQGVVCQQLIKTADGKGRVVATEVLVATPAIRNLIREGKTHQIYSAMQAGAKHGMATMDQHLAELVKKGKVTYDAALEKCHHVEDFNRLCGRV
jgi:twitching motility protein PilT